MHRTAGLLGLLFSLAGCSEPAEFSFVALSGPAAFDGAMGEADQGVLLDIGVSLVVPERWETDEPRGASVWNVEVVDPLRPRTQPGVYDSLLAGAITFRTPDGATCRIAVGDGPDEVVPARDEAGSFDDELARAGPWEPHPSLASHEVRVLRGAGEEPELCIELRLATDADVHPEYALFTLEGTPTAVRAAEPALIRMAGTLGTVDWVVMRERLPSCH